MIYKSIDSDLAKACFSYDSESGNLIWKYRADKYAGRNTRFTGKVAGHIHTCTVGKKYIQIRLDGVLHYAHRIIWVIHNGPIPTEMEIDHIDGNGINNRLSNLRLVSKSTNKRNMRKLSTNTSGHTGVYFDKRRNTYSARVTVNAKLKTIITGVSFERAVEARDLYNAVNGFHPNHGQERPL